MLLGQFTNLVLNQVYQIPVTSNVIPSGTTTLSCTSSDTSRLTISNPTLIITPTSYNLNIEVNTLSDGLVNITCMPSAGSEFAYQSVAAVNIVGYTDLLLYAGSIAGIVGINSTSFISLYAWPTAPVTVTWTTSATIIDIVQSATLTFTSENYGIAQTTLFRCNTQGYAQIVATASQSGGSQVPPPPPNYDGQHIYSQVSLVEGTATPKKIGKDVSILTPVIGVPWTDTNFLCHLWKPPNSCYNNEQLFRHISTQPCCGDSRIR